MTRWVTIALALVACGEAELESVAPEVFALEARYERHVRPILATYCTSCHTGLGERAGGVELDQYESAHAGRVHNVCTAVGPVVVARYAEVLVPFPRSGQAPREACEGWEVGSMPTGARSRPTLEEQVILARWVELGGPR